MDELAGGRHRTAFVRPSDDPAGGGTRPAPTPTDGPPAGPAPARPDGGGTGLGLAALAVAGLPPLAVLIVFLPLIPAILESI